MGLFRWQRWLRRWAEAWGVRRRRPRRAVPRRRPLLEALEDRLAPARTLMWTGSAVFPNWSAQNAGDPATNWLNTSVSPQQFDIPQNGDDLVFPAGAKSLTNTDDMPGLSVGSITFSGGGYSISAKAGTSLTITGSITDQTASSSNAFNVPLLLPSSIPVSVTQSSETLQLGGPIGDAPPPPPSTTPIHGGITKTGAGTLAFSGSGGNTYSGTTEIDQGVFQVQEANGVAGPLVIGPADGSTAASVQLNAAGATANNVRVTVNSSSELFVNGNDTIGALTLNGGTIDLLAPGSPPQPAVLTLGGNVTANASGATSIIGGPGTLSLGGATRTFTVAAGSASPGLIVAVTVADGGNGAGLTKAGAGNMWLAAANTYAGTTQVNAGTLTLNAPSAVVGPLVVGSATLAQIASNNATGAGVAVTVNATGELDVNADDTIGTLALNGGTVKIQGPVGDAPGRVLILGGDVTTTASATTATIEGGGILALATGTLGNATTTFTVAGGAANPDLIVSAQVSDDLSGDDQDELVKAGAGRMVLAGNNTYSGGTDVRAGELNLQNSAALGTGSATVETGAALELQAVVADAPLDLTNALTLNGTGVNGAGALDNVFGNNTVQGDITLASASAIGVDRAADDPTLEDQVTGPGGLTKVGPGVLTLTDPFSGAAANSYGGATQVDQGLLDLEKATAVPGALTVGTGTGTPAQALLGVDAATSPATAVTVNSDGLFATGEDGRDPAPLNGFALATSSDTIASLTLNGGTVSIAGPQQTIGSDGTIFLPASVLTLGGDVIANAAAVTASIQGGGTLSLGGANRTFTVAGGGADPGLAVSAAVADGVPVTPPAAAGGSSAGSLTLTAAGLAAGFTLSTFATNFPQRSDGPGPFGIGFPAPGGVLVSDTPGNVRFFPTDTDGQNAASFPPVAGASYGTNHAEGIARLGNTLYMDLGELNEVAQINNDGTINHVVASVPNPPGIAADPLNGRLFVSAFLGAIYEVDPVTGTATVFANVESDGLAFDPTTNTLYATGYDDPTFDRHIVGFNASTGAQVFDSGVILNPDGSPAKPDGTAVGAGSLGGNLFVNTNDGTLVEVSLATGAQTVLASGGSRGDLVTVDSINDTLLATQSSLIARLIPPSGGGFVGGSPGGLVKAGTGRMVVSGTSSTYSGGTDVTAGELNVQSNDALGSGPATVETGAALELQSPSVDNHLDLPNALTLHGSGVNGAGALDNVRGNNIVEGTVTLADDSAIGVDAAFDDLHLQDQVTGPGGLIKVGPGILTLLDPVSGAAANSYGGATQVDQGLLDLEKAGAVPGALTVGTGTGTPAQVLLGVNAATSPATAVTVNSDGLLAVGEDGSDPRLASFAGRGSSDTIASLTLNGGTVSIAGSQFSGEVAASVLALGGDVTANASAVTAHIQGAGSLLLGGGTRTFTVAGGGADPGLAVSAAIAGGVPAAPGGTSSGGLTLTPAGTLAGFTLSTFATGFQERGDGLGPLSVVFPASGGVLVDDDQTGNVSRFPTDADGQDVNSVPVTASYGFNQIAGITKLGNTLYATTANGNTVVQLNDDGTTNRVIANITNAVGITPDPLTGHLFVSAYAGAIYDVDPVADTATVFANVQADGISFDATTNTLYAVDDLDPGLTGHILGFNGTTGQQVFDSGLIPGNPDGSALGTGALAGNLFVNTNGGTLIEINLATHSQTLIASGGSRGDFVSVDPTNGTLFVTQSGSIARLIPPAGAGFLGGNSDGLTKAGAGRMVLGAANSYTGTTQVNAGTLTLGAASAVIGPLVVGDAPALAQVAVNNGTAATVPVTVNATGELDVGAPGAPARDTIGSLTLNGGTVKIAGAQGSSPASVLTLGGDVTANAAAATASIQGGGTLSLGGANRTFTVAGGGADPGLAVSASVADGVPVTPPAVSGGSSAGGLTLTAAGMAAGFTLSTFASGFPLRSDGAGPFSAVLPASGGVLVSDQSGPLSQPTGNLFHFPTDMDGQNAANFPAGPGAASQALGLARLGNTLYATLLFNDTVAQLNDDGTLNHIVATNIPLPLGIAADPLNGRLFVSAFHGAIYEVDPVAQTATVFARVEADGLTFDPTTNTLYAVGDSDPTFDQHIVGFDATTGAQVFDSGAVSSEPDGIAIGTGVLAGNLFANTKVGTLVEVNLATHAQTLLASGGSRGDFVSVDPSNGTLFVAQSSLLRLIPPAGGGFVGGSPGGLTKAGAGRMVLSGGNTYGGGTDVTAGELNVQSNAALGTGPATVEAGAALEVQAPGLAPVSVPIPLTLNGSGVGGTGALRNVSGMNAWTGTITLASDSSIGVDAGNLDLRTLVTGPGGLTKVGAASLALDNPATGAAANTYGGTTQVDAGLLILAKAGAVPGALTVGTGTGIPAQALLAVNAATAPTTAVTVNSDGLFAVGEDGSDPQLAGFAGAHSSDTIAALTVSGGTVSIAGPQSSLPASVLTLGGDVTTLACTMTAMIQGGGTLSLGGAGRTFTIADGSPDPDLLVSATIADGGGGAGLTKAGAGRVVLGAANSYTGTTQVNDGTLTLGATSAVIGPLVVGDAAATAVIAVDNATAPTVPVTVNATGELDVGAAGASAQDTISSLTLNGGTVSIAGAQGDIPASVLTLGGDVTANAAAATATIGGGGTLSLGGANRTFTVADGAADPDLAVSAAIADGGASAGLTKAGAGRMVLAAANSYSGTTQVSAGTLTLGATSAVIGPLVVGDAAALAQVAVDNATAPGVPVTVNATGELDVNANDTIGTLTLNGGTVVITGTLILGGDVAANAASATATVGGSGSLSLGGTTRTFTVAGGGADPGLVVSATVEDGTSASELVKAGAGRMMLSGANTYSGGTDIQAGELNVQSNAALGTGSATVEAGAALEVQGGLDITNDLTLNGSGVGGTGALRNISGINVWESNKITLASDSAIGVDGGSLELNQAGPVTGPGGLTKVGAGTLLLDGASPFGGAADSYGGPTRVDAGLLVLRGREAVPGPLVVGTGAGGGAQVLLAADAATDPKTAVTVNSDGILAVGFAAGDLGGSIPALANFAGSHSSDTIAALTVNGGTVSIAGAQGAIPASVLTLGGDVMATSGVLQGGGGLSLGGATRTFTVSGGLAVGVTIADGGGGAGLTKAGPGNLILGATNSYTGTTQVNAGTLTLAAPSAVIGPLVVGGAAATAVIAVDNATAPTVPVTVNATGELDVIPQISLPLTDTIGSLTLNGGTVFIVGNKEESPTCTLALGGDVTANASPVTATIRGSGNLSLSGVTRTFTVADGAADPDLLVSAAITDGGASAGLTKAGPGRMVLGAANSYTGTTQVNAGTLTLAAASAVVGPLVVGDAAADTPAWAQITADNATAATVPVTVNGSGELGVGTAGVASNQDTIGPLTLNGGAVFIAGAQGSTAASTLTLGGDVTASGSTGLIGGGGTLSLGSAPRTITVAAGGTLGIDTPVDGTAAATLTKAGPGTLALQTDNTYHGLTVVANGVLDVETALALGDPAAGTTVSSGATLAVVSGPHANGVANIPEPLTLNGPGFGGSAALVSTFLGNLVPNSWAGPIALNADSAVEADDPLTIKGLISGPGGLIVRGTQALTLAARDNNSYRGTTVVDGGDLQLRQLGIAVPGNLVIGTGDGKSSVCDVLGNEQIAPGARVTVNADGVLGINGKTETVGSLTGTGEVILNNSGSDTPGSGTGIIPRPGTLIVGADNTSTTYAGIISGAGGNLVKVGSGVLTLQGNNTYSGTTTVNAGTLLVDGSQPGSAVVVNGGTLGGHGTVGPLTANGGGTVAPGDSPGVLSVHGGATFNPGSIFSVLVNGPAAGSDYSQLNVAGPVVLNGPGLRLSFGFAPARGQDFVLIANNGSGAVQGTFAGIPEDALLAHGTEFFDVSYAGGRGSDVDLLSLSRGDLFVRALFADFDTLSSRTTRASFEGRVAGGESRLTVARDFLTSPARRLAEVNQFYAAFGQPDDGLKGRYVAQLLAGVPAGQVLINFLTSASFRRRHRSNAAFVRALFTGLLGHPPGRHDLLGHQPPAFYVQELNAGTSRAKLVQQLLSSDEVYKAAVVQNFETFLGIKPTPAQLQTLTGQLPSGALNPDALSESIVALDTYIDFFITRAASNRAPGVAFVNV